jgi:hypothetical protein
MLRTLTVALLCLLSRFLAAEPLVAHATEPYRGPVAYVDKKLQSVVYAETDGKHLSAIDFDGQVPWTRSPFVDAHLKPYRVAAPRIIHVYAPLGHSTINMTMRYVHHVEEHHRPIPEEILSAGAAILDPDQRVIAMLGARSAALRGNTVATAPRPLSSI